MQRSVKNCRRCVKNVFLYFMSITMGGLLQAAEVRFTLAPDVPGFSFLSWDTEGSVQTKLNLLRDGGGAVFHVEIGGEWVDGGPLVVGTNAVDGAINLGASGKSELLWTVRTNGAGMVWSLANTGGTSTISRIRIMLPFNPRVAAATVLPSRWLPPDGFALPAVLSAADFGQMLVRRQGTGDVAGRFSGSRRKHEINVSFEIPAPPAGEVFSLEFSPVQLPVPKGVDADTWRQIRRGWWNLYQPCVYADDLDCMGGFLSFPAGVMANNAISDPVSSSSLALAEHALLVPQLAPGVSAGYLVQYSLDYWIDHKTDPSGAVVCYGAIKDMLETPALIVAAAWACVELSGDLEWAEARIVKLEKMADFLAAHDVDHDGIVESPKSGNANTLTKSNERGATSWDTINSGHKEAWINAQAYRAFCCLADLEKQLHRKDQAVRYEELAGRLRAAYYPTFYNPSAQIVTWWISKDGKRHDYWAPGFIGLPISYGLIPSSAAVAMLTRAHEKVKEIGFSRLDIGLPCTLSPFLRADYHQGFGAEFGAPSREDGTDTFGQYLNGGCLVGDQRDWITAHFRAGMEREVAPQLSAMVARQAKPVYPNGGSFQNGILNEPRKGAEFYTWTGEPTGYEGFLAGTFTFLQCVLTQHPEYLQKLLRPMPQWSPNL